MNKDAFGKINDDLLIAMFKITQSFARSKDIAQACEQALKAILTLTDSEFAVLSGLRFDAQHNPFMRIHGVVSGEPSLSGSQMYPGFLQADHVDFHDMNTSYGQVLTTGLPCLRNTPVTGQDSIGLIGSPHRLNTCLLIPLREGGEVSGMLAIANRPGGYSVEMLDWLEPVCAALSCVLIGLRAERHHSKLERELLEARAMEEQANEAKNLFLATISHEIRTPMNAIVGMCDLLRETTLNTAQTYFAKVISHNSELLLSIINDVLDISRLENGRMELLEQEFSLEDLLSEVVELLGHRATEKGLFLVMNYPIGLPRLLMGDRVRIRQILVNLIDNAIKFTDCGHVVVAVSGNNRGTFTIAVQDTGIGICEQSSEALFSLFHQVDQGVARRYGGTGLGLAISQRTAMLLGGVIQVNSQKDRGSTFSFEFPARFSDAAKDPPLSSHLCNLALHVFSTRPLLTEIIQQHLSTYPGAEVFLHGTTETMVAALSRHQAGDKCLILMECGHPDLQLQSLARIGHQNELFVFAPPTRGSKVDLKNMFNESNVLGTVAPYFGFKGFDQTLHQIIEQLQQGQAEPVAMDLNRQRASQPKILLVEDNPINQDVACLVLTQMGCVVDVAFNGIQALEKYTRHSYDLIFMDCQMPLMDGLTATVKIREIEGTQAAKRTPIVAITANALSTDRHVCINAGMDDYLSKPFKRSQVQDVLERFLPLGALSA